MKYNDVNFKKRFGQNFLKDESIVQRIVDIALIDEDSLVIEVGPGGAILTKKLASSAKNVLAYEIDVDLREQLNKKLVDCSNVDVLFKDFLESDIVFDIGNYNYDKIYFVSNVPYYITTPIIMKIIDSKLFFSKIVMMVQKEVGERFTSVPGRKSYGSISVILNYFYDVKCEFFVDRNEFIPAPNVDSVVISFIPKKNKLNVNNFSFFEELVQDSFKFKRKNIRNNLGNYDLNEVLTILKKHGFDLTARAEQLSLEIFVEMANSLSEKK